MNIRTDLALKICEHLTDESGKDIFGVEITNEKNDERGISVTWINIKDENGAAAMNKPKGNYVTLNSCAMKENDPDTHAEIAKILARKLGRLHNLNSEAVNLVVGLGNRQVTLDALDPMVCEKLLATRHLDEDVSLLTARKALRHKRTFSGCNGVNGH